MALSFIPAWLAATLLVVGVLGLLFKNRLSMMIARVNPLFPAQTTLMVFAVLGILAGGFGVITAAVSGFSVASIGGGDKDAGNLPVSAQMLERCEYASGISNATAAFTARADPSDPRSVFIDLDRDIWDYANNNTAQGEINVTYTCTRSGSTQEAESYLIVLKGTEFKNETGGTEANVYNILETGSTPSTIWTGKYQQTIYAKDGNYATSSDTREHVYLGFGAGEKTATLTIWGEVSETGTGALNNYTQKDVTISQRVNGADSELGRIKVLIVP